MSAHRSPAHQALLAEAEAQIRRGQVAAGEATCRRLLEREPGLAGAWFLLGAIAIQARTLPLALDQFTRAARLDPDEARYHAQVARCLLQLNRPPEARAAALRAAQAPRTDPSALDTIGGVLAGLGDPQAAVGFHRRAVDGGGRAPGYLYNLGVALQQLGELAEAEACYRSVTAAAPGAYQAWYALVRLRRQTPHDDIAPTLERLFERATDAVSAFHLGHALAKVHEDLEDYDAALHWLARAKAGRRQSLSYSPEQDRMLYAAAAALAEPPHSRSGRESEARPIFVVGMPRSGTTLVERILAGHSQVTTLGESAALAVAVKEATQIAPSLPVDIESLVALRTADAAAIGERYLMKTAQVGQARRVDKAPVNLLYAGLIHRALPNARIVCLRRDPLDTCLANYAQLFASLEHHSYSLDMAATAQRFVNFDRLVGSLRAALPPASFLELHYEQLIAAPEAEVRRLLTFCHLDWEPACLDFHLAAGPVRTASSVQVRRPLHAGSVGRARRFGAGLQPMLAVLAEAGLTAP